MYFNRTLQPWLGQDYQDDVGGWGGGYFRPQVPVSSPTQPQQQLAPQVQQPQTQQPTLAQMFQQGQQPNQLTRMFGMWQR